jgi:BTB/POZ domain
MDKPLADLCPSADVILRSHDFHQFRVPKSFIVNNSPILGELIHKTLGPLADVQDVASLPVVELPESGPILHNLLSFLFPGIPLVPSTTEKAMELLSVAQKYQMDSVLDHIRLSISRHNPPSTQQNAALDMYSFAQKYGLRQEALQAARAIILKYPINIEDLEDKLDMMSGASLYELWKYSEDVWSALASDLSEFRTSAARGTLTGLHCVEFSSSKIPLWLDDYIASIGDTPSLFDLIEFSIALARHAKEKAGCRTCACTSLPSQTIRNFWEALASMVDGSFEKVM